LHSKGAIKTKVGARTGVSGDQMRQEKTNDENLQKDTPVLVEATHTSADTIKSFASRLRALGQALEKFGLYAFDLKIRNGTYQVIDQSNTSEHGNSSFLRFVKESLRFFTMRPNLAQPACPIFSGEDIERFDLTGKSRRQDPTKVPDPYGISQLLRGAGCYLDNRNATREVEISLNERWIKFSYRTGEGRLIQTEHDLEYFYDYWIKMYLHRSNRPKPFVPSAPTVRLA
jgi:hypothetical protein